MLLSFLLVPALLIGCTKNDKSKGPGAGSSITGTSTNGLFSLTVNVNPNNTNKGGSVGITVLAQTLNGAPLANRNVQMATTGGTLASVAGSTDAAGKFVTTLAIPPDYNGANPIVVRATVDNLIATGNVFVNDLGALAIVPSSATMAPGATQFFNCTGGVPPYRWEPSGGTLNRLNEPSVIFTAGSATGIFVLKCTDSAGNAASATITISGTVAGPLTILPGNVSLNQGQVQVFQASGGVPPYTWTATGGTPTTGTGNTFTYTAGSVPGTFSVTLTDSINQATSRTVTIVGVGTVTVSANPGSVPCGGTSTITAAVFDTNGNRLAGVKVTFSTSAGTLSATDVFTNSLGEAVTTFTATSSGFVACAPASASGSTGTATITAVAGGKSGSAVVTVIKP